MPCNNCNCDSCVYFRENDGKRKVIFTDNDEKLCSKCKVYKNLNEFHSNGKKGKRSECIICRIETNKKAYLRRKEKLKTISVSC